MSARCSTPTSMCVSARELLLYVCASACMCVCVCVFIMFASVCQRERERARASERASERARERASERERAPAGSSGRRWCSARRAAHQSCTSLHRHSRSFDCASPWAARTSGSSWKSRRGRGHAGRHPRCGKLAHAPLAQSRMRAALAACPRAPRFDVRIGLAAQARDTLVKVL